MNCIPFALSLAFGVPLGPPAPTSNATRALPVATEPFALPAPAPDFALPPDPTKLGPPPPSPLPGGLVPHYSFPKPGDVHSPRQGGSCPDPRPSIGPEFPGGSGPVAEPTPALDEAESELEIEIRLSASEPEWSAAVLVPRMPRKLKAVHVELVVRGDWTMRSESLAPVFEPPTTVVQLHGESSVRVLGYEATAFGILEQSFNTRFDGALDWSGDSGETSSAAEHGVPLVTILPPAPFEGTGYLRLPIHGSQAAHHHVVEGSRDTLVEAQTASDVRLRLRYVAE